MTAHATLEERDRCVAAGMIGHISKPIEPAMLFGTLSKLHRASAKEGGGPADQGAAHVAPAKSSDDIPVIDGLDTKDGLMRVAGNRKLYLKLLGQFKDQQKETIAQIAASVAKGDIATAERLAHTLKGVAGNLGAKPVQAEAGKVEKLLREKAAAPTIEAALRAVAAVLDPLLVQLPSAIITPAAVASGAPTAIADPVQTKAAAIELAKLLADSDASATDFVEKNQAALRPAFAPPAWEKFLEHTQGFAFEEARALLLAALPEASGSRP